MPKQSNMIQKYVEDFFLCVCSPSTPDIGLPWSVVTMPNETPLEKKSKFSFLS